MKVQSYKDNFYNDGVIKLKNFIDLKKVEFLREEVERNSLKQNFFLLSKEARIIASNIVNIINDLTGKQYYYVGESHAVYNQVDNARVWHKDLRGDVVSEQDEMCIVRAIIYLQDHKNYSYGSKIIEGSHLRTLYPFWSIKSLIKTTINIIKNLKIIKLKNMIPVNFFKAKNISVMPGDVAIWSLNSIHSGNFVRLKIFPNLYLPVLFDKFLDKYLKRFIKIDDKKRAIISFTFGTKCLTTKNYVTERISKSAIPVEFSEYLLDIKNIQNIIKISHV